MTDLRTLTDAFTELERRADAVPVRATDTIAFDVRSKPHHQRTLLVAASVVGVAAVAGGAVLLAGTDSNHSGAPAGGPSAASSSAPSSSASSSSAPSSSPRPPAPSPSSTGASGSAAPSTPESSGTATSTAPAGGDAATAALLSRLRTALGKSSRVSVTDTSNEPGDPAIVGVLSVAGHRGGFDLQTYDAGKGQVAFCDDSGSSHCTVHRYSDGSSLAVGSEGVLGGGRTYQAQYVLANGRAALMHVSNERVPKGKSGKLSANPPLTKSQMTAIVRDPRILAIN